MYVICLVVITSTMAEPPYEKLTNFRDIEVQFAKMTTRIKLALINNKVDVALLIERLCTISAVANKKVPLFDEDVFQKIETIDKFWKKLRNFWSIFDYELLWYVVEISECKEAQNIFEEFLSRINPSTIEDVDLVLHCKKEHWEGSLKPVLRIKVNAEECTLDIKKKVEEIVSKTYNLTKYALQLICIKRGCIELFYYISKPVKLHLLQFEINRAAMESFVACDIISLRIGDKFELKVPPMIANIVVSNAY